MCCKNKLKICLLKLKFIDYVNNDMLKETKNALELISIIDCQNLEIIKNELNNIVNNLEYGANEILSVRSYVVK